MRTPSVRAARVAALEWYESAQHRPTAEAPEELRLYDAAEAKRVRGLMRQLGLSQVQAAREAGLDHSGALAYWLRGENVNTPRVRAAGVAVIEWCKSAQHQLTPEAPEELRLYDAAEAERVQRLIRRLDLSQAQAAREAGLSSSDAALAMSLCSEHVNMWQVHVAGAAMVEWYKSAKQRPTPEEPEELRPYDASEAERVAGLIRRLGITQQQVAHEARLNHYGALSKWLHIKEVNMLSVRAARVAALEWYESAQHQPTPGAAAEDTLRPYVTTEVERVHQLIQWLSIMTKRAACEAGSSQGALSRWLCADNLHMPAVRTAGAAALEWCESAQHQPTPEAAEEPWPYNTAEVEMMGVLICCLSSIPYRRAHACL